MKKTDSITFNIERDLHEKLKKYIADNNIQDKSKCIRGFIRRGLLVDHVLGKDDQRFEEQ